MIGGGFDRILEEVCFVFFNITMLLLYATAPRYIIITERSI